MTMAALEFEMTKPKGQSKYWDDPKAQEEYLELANNRERMKRNAA